MISYKKYEMTLKEQITAWGTGIGLAAAVSYTFYRSIWVFLALVPGVLFYVRYRKWEFQKKRLLELKLQFKEGIRILASSLGAGYSVENALAVSQRELNLLYGSNDMVGREFAYMVQQMKTNRPIEVLMLDFAERSGLEEMENFAAVFGAAKRSGGRLVPIIQHTADMIQDKIQIQEEIRTLTASRQFEQKIMNVLPFFIIFYIDQTSPGLFDVMYQTMLGRIVMTVCLVIYAAAILLAGKILNIPI